MKRIMLVLIAAMCGVVFAQSRFLEVQPKRTNDYDDNRTNGYCVVRLRVDNEVVVHIRSNRLGFETVLGRDARDEGSECSQAMPTGSALANFQFKGVDGRGNVTLAEAPNSGNSYTARVRIQDSKGGDEGYTFRVQWDNRNPGQVSDNTGFGGRRGRVNDNSGWGTTQNNQNSGWGTTQGNSNSGWGTTNSGNSGWGTGTATGTAWGQSDFEQTATGTGVARMAGQPDLNLTSTRLRLRQGGQFVLEITGAETVRFSGTWRRDGDAAILAINNGFANGGANGTGRAVVVNNQLQSLTLDGRNRATNVAFQVEFRNSTANRRYRR
jgi:hypothetical protein